MIVPLNQPAAVVVVCLGFVIFFIGEKVIRTAHITRESEAGAFERILRITTRSYWWPPSTAKLETPGATPARYSMGTAGMQRNNNPINNISLILESFYSKMEAPWTTPNASEKSYQGRECQADRATENRPKCSAAAETSLGGRGQDLSFGQERIRSASHPKEVNSIFWITQRVF